jgi:DNA repair exonuclease SbcCD nuclease subunit
VRRGQIINIIGDGGKVRKIIHAADLHLEDGEEKAYCYGVLDEIIALALAEKAGALVLAGDLFDSFADFEALRSEVCAKFKPLAEAGCPIIYIPGNHESRGAAADLTA